MPIRLLAAVFAAALALAACGGDDAPSKSEFIEKADAICRENEERSEEIAREGLRNPENPTGREVLAILDRLVPVQRDAVGEIRDLEKPEGDEDEINEFLGKVDQALDEIEQIDHPRAALAALQANDTPQDPFREANDAAEDYGFDDCAE